MGRFASFLFIVAMFSLIRPVNAQTSSSVVNEFNLGIGVFGDSYTAKGNTTSLPPLILSYEPRRSTSKFAVGAILAVTSDSYDPVYLSNKTIYYESYFIVGIRPVYHFILKNNFDLYAGLMVGQYFAHYTIDDSNTHRLAFDLFVGGKYYFSDNFGAMAELGYGISILKLGLSVKF